MENPRSDVTANRQQLLQRGTRSIQQARYDGETTYQNMLGSSYRNFQQASETVRAVQQQLLFHAKVGTNNAKNGVENVYERMIWLSGYCSTSARTKVEAFNMRLASNSNQKILDARQLLNRNLREIGTQSSQQLLIVSTGTLRQFSMLQRSAERFVSLPKSDVTILIEKLLLQDAMRILSRGFVYIQSSSGQVITNKYDLHVGQKISIHMKDGEINAIISGE